jgi:hypothetical protein
MKNDHVYFVMSNSLQQLIACGILDPDLANAQVGVSGAPAPSRQPTVVHMQDDYPGIKVRYVDGAGAEADLTLSLDPESDPESDPELGSESESESNAKLEAFIQNQLKHCYPLDQDRRQGRTTVSMSASKDDLELKYYKTVQYHWLYSSPSYGWWHYDKEDNDRLENAYNGGKSTCESIIGNQSFHFDFERMTQRGRSHTTRQILRVTSLHDIALKGVAGSCIEKDDIIQRSKPSQERVEWEV